MALTSGFYDGPVTETDRATSRAGAPDYGVYGVNDFQVVAHPSIPYALNVKAGRAHGHGVTDTAASDQTVQADSLSSGTRFDLVVVRRNWQPLLGGPSTLVVIKGGAAAPDIQAVRKIGPGVEDDQPIALLEWRGNVNTPFKITDLRCWAANGGMVAADTLALNYLAKPAAEVLIGGVAWRYALVGNGVWGWVRTNAAAGTVTVSIPAANKYRSVSVTLPPGFATAPSIGLTITSNLAYPATKLIPAAINKSATKFDAKLVTADGNPIGTAYNITMDWTATP